MLLVKNYHFTANLSTNMIEHASEMEMYNSLPTLEMFLLVMDR